MVTGCAAFQGSSSSSICHAILHDEPIAPRRLNPAVPAALERIILEALQKDRELRYQRASDMRADVERLQHRAVRQRQYSVAAAVVLLLAFVGGIALWRSPGARDMFANVRVRQLTHNSSEGSVGSGAISPDGRHVAYTDARGIHVQTVETDEMRTIPESGNLPDATRWDLEPGWLPDGSASSPIYSRATTSHARARGWSG
jgi:hypothetical protein